MRLAWFLLAPNEEMVVLLKRTAGKDTRLDWEAPTTILNTRPGLVIGTVENMSPEQEECR
jgi:hypothetical protein